MAKQIKLVKSLSGRKKGSGCNRKFAGSEEDRRRYRTAGKCGNPR